MLIIFVFVELQQEDYKFEASPVYRLNSRQRGYIADSVSEGKEGREAERTRE